MQKFKNWMHGKAARMGAALSAASLALVGVASAAESDAATGIDLTGSLQTGFQGIVSQAGQVLAVIVPVGLGLAGTIWLARKAMSWFKGMSKG